MSMIKQYVDRLVTDSTPQCPAWNKESQIKNKKPHWNYIDGCMMSSLIELSKTEGARYFDFAREFIDYYVDERGDMLGYDINDYNIDSINEGRVLFDLYAVTGIEKYRLAIEKLYEQLRTHPRIELGNFWHKKIYPEQVWLDGLYMAQVFYTRYIGRFCGGNGYDDVVGQFQNVRKYMFDEQKQLYRHGWDYSKKAFWADEKGLSKSFWLRAMGWYVVALVDVIDYMGVDSHSQPLKEIFAEAMNGLVQYRTDGMFCQVVDQIGREGNYLETSGSCMAAYALIKGARMGLLNSDMGAIGRQTFESIASKNLHVTESGFSLGNICLSAGLGPESNRLRDGTYEYYVGERIVSDDAKGVAPFVMAYSELLK